MLSVTFALGGAGALGLAFESARRLGLLLAALSLLCAALLGLPSASCSSTVGDREMDFQDCLNDAIEMVLDWDLSDEACTEAVTVQACMLAGVEPDDIPG